MWGRVSALIIKELLAVWRDKKSRFVLIGPPLIQLLVFSYAATYDITNVTVGLLDLDGGAPARDLVARIKGAPTFHHVLRLERDADVARVIDSREAALVVRLDDDFSRRLIGAPPAPIQVILDGRRSNNAQLLHSYVATIVADFNRDWAEAHGQPSAPAVLATRAWFNPNLHSRWMIVPGLVAVLTMVVALVVTALSVARERELGTFDQLQVTPLRPFEILLGKTLPAVLIGLTEATVIVLAARLWFEVPLEGSVLLLYASLLVYLLAVVGIGLFISSLVSTQQQAILGAFLFLVPAIILSGFATPIENMPDWLQTLTQANPIRHFMVIVRGLFLKGLPASLLWDSLWPMAVIATATLSAAAWLFRHRLQD